MTKITNTQKTVTTLHAIRAKLDLTQEQLAVRLGVSIATVNRWEGGINLPQKAARATIAALATEAGADEEAIDLVSVEAAANVTRRRTKARSSSHSTKSMEQMLWDAACSIRGEKDASKFKDYLLPLLFLKRLSDVFDDEIARLAEEYADHDVALEVAEEDHELLRFYLPPEARWSVISGREDYDWPDDEQGQTMRPRDIGEHLTKAMRSVVRHNPSLSGVIDVVDFAAERNGERDINPARLRQVIETFSDSRYRLGLADVQPDFLGRAYEYLLRKFAEGSGQSAGEFFTPTEVGLLMAHIMRPKPGDECHDYACGSAGLLIKLQLVARELDPTSKVPLRLYGQELTPESYAMSQMNATIHDMNIEMARGDTMINPKFKTVGSKLRAYDIIVANPMWNQQFNPDIFADDPFDRFRTAGGVTSGKGDWAWLQHTLACLNEKGRAAVVLDTGSMTRGSGSKNEDKERNIRKWFIDNDLIDGVILLPDNLFYNTSSAGVIVILSKRKPATRKGRIVILNATRHAQKGRPKNFIPEKDIRQLAATYQNGKPVEGKVSIITNEKAAEADYNLSPNRWVSNTHEQNQRPISEIIANLSELNEATLTTDTNFTSLLTSLRDIKQATIRVLFSKTWPLRPLGELFEISAGQAMSPAARDGEDKVSFLRTSNVHWDEINLTKVDEMFIPAHELQDKLLRQGDLLVCEGGEIGRAAIWRGERDVMSFQNHLHRLRPLSGDVVPRFYVYFLQYGFTQFGIFEGAGNKTTIPNLSRNRLATLSVPHPDLSEQKDIVRILACVGEAIKLHRQKNALHCELFKAILHKLMTNEIRVKDVDLSEIDLKFEAKTYT